MCCTSCGNKCLQQSTGRVDERKKVPYSQGKRLDSTFFRLPSFAGFLSDFTERQSEISCVLANILNTFESKCHVGWCLHFFAKQTSIICVRDCLITTHECRIAEAYRLIITLALASMWWVVIDSLRSSRSTEIQLWISWAKTETVKSMAKLIIRFPSV